jgi:hypothetical protein
LHTVGSRQGSSRLRALCSRTRSRSSVSSTFWWFEEFPGLLDRLRERFGCVLENRRLVVFDLADSGEVGDVRDSERPYVATAGDFTGRRGRNDRSAPAQLDARARPRHRTPA